VATLCCPARPVGPLDLCLPACSLVSVDKIDNPLSSCVVVAPAKFKCMFAVTKFPGRPCV
jgi:hypothetical protein